MEISALQQEVDTWIKTYGVRYFNELTNTAILMEEVGELARIMARKYGEQSFKHKEEEKQLGDEMADVLWVLLLAQTLQDQLGPNPAEALIRATGDWTLRSLCVVLAVTPLRTWLGWPELLRFRRMLGLLVFGYASLHLVCYAWFDMGFDLADTLQDLQIFLRKRRRVVPRDAIDDERLHEEGLPALLLGQMAVLQEIKEMMGTQEEMELQEETV